MVKTTSEIRRKQIIRVILEIISEKGVSRLTTAEVAKRVGFTEAALFRYFPSKAEMIKTTMVDVNEGLLLGIGQIVNQNLEPIVKLEAILKFQLAYLNQNKGMSRIILSDELHLANHELRDTIRQRQSKYITMVKAVIQEGVLTGIYRKDLDVTMAARAFFGLIQTAVFAASLNNLADNMEDHFRPISEFLRGCFVNRGD